MLDQNFNDIFMLLDRSEDQLDRVFQDRRRLANDEFQEAVMELVGQLQVLAKEVPDQLLGAVRLMDGSGYNTIHQLHSGILALFLGEINGWSDEDVRSLAAAALTHDIGMVTLQNLLDKHRGELSPVQRSKIQQHPIQGVELLRDNGVADPIWLEGVLHHHERLDGDGYPNQLKGEEISRAGQMIGVVDVYSAMVSNHGYRTSLGVRDSLKHMLLEQGGGLARDQIQLLIKIVGIYPPGTMVLLSSGERGLVFRRGSVAHQPTIYVVTGADGSRMRDELIHDLSGGELEIKGIVPDEQRQVMLPDIKTLWNRIHRVKPSGTAAQAQI